MSFLLLMTDTLYLFGYPSIRFTEQIISDCQLARAAAVLFSCSLLFYFFRPPLATAAASSLATSDHLIMSVDRQPSCAIARATNSALITSKMASPLLSAEQCRLALFTVDVPVVQRDPKVPEAASEAAVFAV